MSCYFFFRNNETVPKLNSKSSQNTCKTILKLKSVRKCKYYPVFTLKHEENLEKLLALSFETTSLEENQSEASTGSLREHNPSNSSYHVSIVQVISELAP